VETSQLIIQELFRSHVDQQKLVKILLFVVERRIWLNRSLMVTFWVGATIGVSKLD